MPYINFNDISENNAGYDVKNDPNPAIAIRVSTGALMRFDYLAARNYDDAIAAGKVPILYHYAGANDPIDEAKLFLAAVSPLSAGDVYALDAETGQSRAWKQAFIDYVRSQTNNTNPWDYMNISTTNALGGPIDGCALWLAAPSWDFDATIPNMHYPIMAQQGPIVDGHDTNAFFGSLDQLKAYAYKEVPHDIPTPAQPVSDTPAPGSTVAPTETPDPLPVVVPPVAPIPAVPTGPVIDIIKPKETPMNPIKTITAVENTVVAHPEEVAAVLSDASHVKSGWKTSEFWTTLATAVASLAAAVLPNDSLAMKITGLVTIAVVTTAYIIGRAKIKAAQGVN